MNTPTTASTPTTGPMMDLEWNPQVVCQQLQAAAKILSDRHLKLAAKWAIEQWMGLPAEVLSTPKRNSTKTDMAAEWILDDLSPATAYAKTLMDLGDYEFAAATLSQPQQSTGNHTPSSKLISLEASLPPPLPDLQPYELYLRAYAMYLAGERRKEQEAHQQPQVTPPTTTSTSETTASPSKSTNKLINPYLPQLLHELSDAYQAQRLDAFGLYMFGTVLWQASEQPTVIPTRCPKAHFVLMESIKQFPYNWSAWLDLAECALQDSRVERDIEDTLQPTLSSNYMYHFFCAHLQQEHQAHNLALQLYEQWMDPALFGGSPYLLTQYGTCLYHLRQLSNAQQLFFELHCHMPYRLDAMDIYSNILYVQEDAVNLCQLAHTATQVDKYRAETCVIVGNYYSLKQQRAKAIQYFGRALKLDRTFCSAWTLMGHEYVEWKQTANAIDAYRQAVQASPGDYRAWYGLGQTYEFLNMHLYALYYYKKAVQLRPYDARMWCALGTTFLALDKDRDAIRAYERALQQGDAEGVATQKLASLYRHEGRTEKAAQCFMKYLEHRYQVTNPTTTDPSTLSMEQLLQGLVVESNEAEAILFLAYYYNDHQEYETAKIFCSRLLEYPGPEKEEAKARLHELRSLSLAGTTTRRIIPTRSRVKQQQRQQQGQS